MKRTGLGKGISALFSDEALNEIEPKNEDNVKEVDINLDISDKNKIVELKVTEVEPNIKQARKEFNYKKLEELAESIKTFGVVQPIIVAKKDTHYEIIAGERRWRASKLANLKTIPAIIKDDEELENVHISIIENVQRENLNAIEKAQGYKDAIEKYNMTPEDFAKKIGKSKSSITDILEILNLDERVIELARKENLSEAGCKMLLEIEDKEKQYEMALYILEDGLSVEEAKKRLKLSKKVPKNTPKIDIHEFREIEEKFTNYFGAKAKIKVSPKNINRGQIVLKYNSNEELERMLELLDK
jgi:stage 0 sporulation protein J